MTARRWLLALVAAAGLLLPHSAPMRAAMTHEVEIVDFAFSPATVTIAVGDTVTWTNADAVAHTATGAGFDSGLLEQGESYSVTFTAPGTYDYLCTPHPTMTGRIVVQAAAPAPSAAPGAAVPDVAMAGPAGASPASSLASMLMVAAAGLALAWPAGVGVARRRTGGDEA
jgi:amicyanin